ncbi:MAG: TolC family protein [Edaphobacter sp.]
MSIAGAVAWTCEGQVSPALSLNDAISAGLKHHPRIAHSEAQVELARSALLEAKAAQQPMISADEDMTYSNDPVFSFGSKLRQARFGPSDFGLPSLNHPAALANFSTSATATWTVFDAGSARHRVASAHSALMAAQLSTKYTDEELGAQITQLYYRALLAEDEVSVAASSVSRAKELASDVQDRTRTGLSLESDSMRATLAQRTAEDDLAAAHGDVALARRDLFDAIGIPQSDHTLMRPMSESSLDAKLNQIPGVPETRLDVQAVRLQESASRQSHDSYRAAAWPRLSMYGHVESDAEHVVTNGSGNWTIAAKLELPIFDGGVRKARGQEADARLHLLQAEERETILAARSTTAHLQNQIEDLNRRYRTAQSAVQAEKEAVQTVRDRYDSGIASISDLLSNERDLEAAQFNRVKIFYQLCIANADLAFASGSSSTSKAGQL